MIVKNNFLEFVVLLLLIIFSLSWRLVDFPDSIACYKPDFLLLSLFFILLYIPEKINIWLAWLIGIFADSLNGFALGNEALQLAFLALIVNLFHRRIYLYPIIQQSLVVMSISIITTLFNALIYFIIFDSANYCYFYSIISNTLIWPLFYFIVHMVYKRSYSVK